jgi:hypothetical protein
VDPVLAAYAADVNRQNAARSGCHQHTISKYVEGILAYVRSGLSNGRTEGLNGKARTITRRAYGFHSASALIALLMLCCSGMHLEPVFHWPGFTH